MEHELSIKSETAKNVKKFTDYRAFLVAYAQEKKQNSPAWSYGAWARMLGLKTTSSITKILNGEREAGSRVIEQMVAYFKFRDKDARYFRDLVRLHKIRSDARLAVLLMEKMGKEHPDATRRLMDERMFRVISNWYYLPLRELTRIPGFRNDPDWISKHFRFKVTARDIERAIHTFIELKILRRDDKGLLAVNEGQLDTTDDVTSEAIKRYHEQMLGNAREALRSQGVQEREFSGSCFAMRSGNVGAAKEMLREFKQKFVRTFEETGGDTVYQVQLQFFPLTKQIKKGEENEVQQ
ncbi:MAG: hypothetical protein A2583_11925 [Bdellovibrionales bacterium RIFOXYD1_FULL_53_11]|nr:MAG: hypothetical protein A2583_11925 [Bdellovibrionales bacterium RIFOXYD1_FULL_53_11]